MELDELAAGKNGGSHAQESSAMAGKGPALLAPELIFKWIGG
jgi:hypothetical protein